MKISEVKEILNQIGQLNIALPNGELVPSHFHVTEVGLINKHFIDCGGTIRKEQKASFQLWQANDYDHRLNPEKLLKIIELSEQQLELPNLEVEVEYQADTIGKYGLDFFNGKFQLVSLQTDCLAKDNCGVPNTKPKRQLAELGKDSSCCTPGGNCC